MKKLLLVMMLSSTVSFGVSINTEVLIEFPQEKSMNIRAELCMTAMGETNKEAILNQNFTLKQQPSYNDVETLKTALESVLMVGTFLCVITEALSSSAAEGLAAFSMSDLPIKVLITRPLLPIYFGFIRKFDNTYFIKKDDDDWLEPINKMEEINNEWDETIRNMHLNK